MTDDDVTIDVAAISGSAAVGRVVEAGSRATVLLGRTVLVGTTDPCGECEICRRGGAPVCPHARRRVDPGKHLVAAGRWVVALGDGLELPLPAAAAVAGDVALAYTLYARTGIAAREPAVIIGATAVTRFLIEILIAKGITPTVVAETADAAWCEWLASKGDRAVVAHAAGGQHELHAAVTAAVASQGIGARPWRVIATSPGAASRAAALAGPRSTLTLLAGIATLPGDLVTREVTVIGVAAAHPDLIVECAAMCVKGEIDLAGGITTRDDDPTRARVRIP